MENNVKVRDVAGLVAHCNVAIIDNGNGKQLFLGEPNAVCQSIYADAICERITANLCAISLWVHHDEVVRVTGGRGKGVKRKQTGKRKYIRKCGICGERHEQSEMYRTEQSPNGWLCADCLNRIHPEYGTEEF